MKHHNAKPCANPRYLDRLWDRFNDELLAQHPDWEDWAVDDPRNEAYGKTAAQNEEATMGLLESCPKLLPGTSVVGIEKLHAEGSCQLAPGEVCPLKASVDALRAIHGDL